MCLIICSDKGFDSLDDELLTDIYRRNGDGFGYMYYDDEKGRLVTHKGLYSLAETKRLVRSLPNDRTVFVHWRMATSGSVHADMCHPYKVHKNLALMHNGVMAKFEPSTKKRINNFTGGNKDQMLPSTQERRAAQSKNEADKSSSGKTTQAQASGPTAGTAAYPVAKPDRYETPQNASSKKSNKKKENRVRNNDTINFMNSYLRPSLKVDPYIWMDENFIDQTENAIGMTNKLVLMDGDGNFVIYNEDQWVEYEGMLFSNTYAWPYSARVKSALGNPYGSQPSYREEAADACFPGDTFRYTDAGELLVDKDYNPPKVIKELSDLYGMTWEQLFEVVLNEPDVIADILYYTCIEPMNSRYH